MDRALFDADSRHQDDGQNKPKHHPANSARHFSPIKHLNQKENQAADEEHDEQGIEGGDEVIQDCFLNSLLGAKFRDLPAAGSFVRRDHEIWTKAITACGASKSKAKAPNLPSFALCKKKGRRVKVPNLPETLLEYSRRRIQGKTFLDEKSVFLESKT